MQGNTVHVLDLAARLDSTAEYLCKAHWGDLSFPPPFGREAMPEVTGYDIVYVHCMYSQLQSIVLYMYMYIYIQHMYNIHGDVHMCMYVFTTEVLYLCTC